MGAAAASGSKYTKVAPAKVTPVRHTRHGLEPAEARNGGQAKDQPFGGRRCPQRLLPAIETRCLLELPGSRTRKALLGSADVEGFMTLWDVGKSKLLDATPWHDQSITVLLQLRCFKLPKMKVQSQHIPGAKKFRRPPAIICTCSLDGHIKVFDLKSGNLLVDLDQKCAISCAVETREGYLMVGFRDIADVKFFDLIEQRMVAKMYGHRCPGVNQIDLLRNGRSVSAGADGTVKVWPSPEEWDYSFSREEIPASPSHSEAEKSSAPIMSPVFGVSTMSLIAPTDAEWKLLEDKRPKPITIQCFIKHAEHVPAVDAWYAGGKADPYVVLRVLNYDPLLGDAPPDGAPPRCFAESTGPVKYNILNPHWDWKCIIEAPGSDKPLFLQVMLLDHDFGIHFKDKIIGHFAFPISDMLLGVFRDRATESEDCVFPFTRSEGRGRTHDYSEPQPYPIVRSAKSPKEYDLSRTRVSMAFRADMEMDKSNGKARPPGGQRLPRNVPSLYHSMKGATALTECGREHWRLCVGYDTGVMCVWDLAALFEGDLQAHTPLYRVQAQNSPITTLLWHPRAQRIISTGLESLIRLWQADLHPDEVSRLSPSMSLELDGWVMNAIVLRDGRLIAVTHSNQRTTGLIAVWD